MTPDSKRDRIEWQKLLGRAAEITHSFNMDITLRQLFYQLVSLPHDDDGWLPNTDNYYGSLGRYTAAARREGRFPALIDPTREIHVPAHWESTPAALRALHEQYRNDRTAGQEYQVWMASEKKGMVALMRSWYGTSHGIPVIALGGQSSTAYNEEIMAAVADDGRLAILLYAGDHDPAGWRILHTFIRNTGCWANPELPEYPPTELDEILGYTRPEKKNSKPQPIPNYALDRKYRIALMPEQCVALNLVRNAAKEKDPNMQSFIRNFEGTLTPDEVNDGLGVQIELDAVNPNTLRDMFSAAIDRFWDDDAYQEVLDAEDDDREELGSYLRQAQERRQHA
jgi:hypothetical protein